MTVLTSSLKLYLRQKLQLLCHDVCSVVPEEDGPLFLCSNVPQYQQSILGLLYTMQLGRTGEPHLNLLGQALFHLVFLLLFEREICCLVTSLKVSDIFLLLNSS